MLQEHREEFDERNSFLYFVLGMISLSQSVMGSLGLPGQPMAAPAQEPPSPEEAAQVPLPFSLLR